MSNVDIILKFKEICDKDFQSPDAMMQSHATDVSYKSGVQAVKNDMAKLILELMQKEVKILEDSDKMPDVKVTKSNVPEPVRMYLQTKGYVVKHSETMGWTASLVHQSILRGGSKTENGAWSACYIHYQRSH